MKVLHESEKDEHLFEEYYPEPKSVVEISHERLALSNSNYIKIYDIPSEQFIYQFDCETISLGTYDRKLIMVMEDQFSFLMIKMIRERSLVEVYSEKSLEEY